MENRPDPESTTPTVPPKPYRLLGTCVMASAVIVWGIAWMLYRYSPQTIAPSSNPALVPGILALVGAIDFVTGLVFLWLAGRQEQPPDWPQAPP